MAKRNLPKVTLIALVLVGATLILATFGAITVTTNLSSSGTVATSPGISVYSDAACTTNVTSLDWGTITPGGTVTRTIYVKNTGSGISLSLGMSTSNWIPTTANGPITITWNRQGSTLAPGQSISAIITLQAASSITDITNFSVQIFISGTA